VIRQKFLEFVAKHYKRVMNDSSSNIRPQVRESREGNQDIYYFFVKL